MTKLLNSLRAAALAARNYTDSAGRQGERFENLDLITDMPFFNKALRVSEEAVLPDGRKIPINDTWAYKNGVPKPTEITVSRLWHSLGNAALGVGEGLNQTMLNVNWSGNYGHSHYDNASIILYAKGAEMLPDIGYTHGKYRGWTLHTASHNTVVIDQQAQDAGTVDKPVTGKLLYYDDKHSHVKAIDVDASPAYSKAESYRRRLILVHAAPGHDYVIDRFDVRGGQTHDWFLHGMCEEEGTLSISTPLNQVVNSLVPDWGGQGRPKNQYDSDLAGKKIHAYSYMKDVRRGLVNGPWTATWNYQKSGIKTHNIAQTGAQIFSFKSPTIRRANEDDNKLDDYMGNGLMQRHTGGSSSFVAVHEPFEQEPWITSVNSENDSTYIIRYKLMNKEVEDRVHVAASGMYITSTAGWVYNSGKQQSGSLVSYTNKDGVYKLEVDKNVKNTGFVRLEVAGGRTFYYPVKAVSGKWLQLFDDPGFTLDKQGKLKFLTFPHEEFASPVTYTVFEKTN